MAEYVVPLGMDEYVHDRMSVAFGTLVGQCFCEEQQKVRIYGPHPFHIWTEYYCARRLT